MTCTPPSPRCSPTGGGEQPADIADVVAFLVSDEGAWIRGQVLEVEGGFNRFAWHNVHEQ